MTRGVAEHSGVGVRQTVDLRIAGVSCWCRTDSDDVARELRVRYSERGGSRPRGATLTADIRVAQVPFDVSDPRGIIDITRDRAIMQGRGRMNMVYERRRHEAEIWVQADDLSYNLELCFRLMFAVLAVEGGGVMLHSGGVVRDARGYVFSGPSGAGKTTVAGLSGALGYAVLSDDFNVLWVDDGGVTLWGVPFRGMSCPLPTQEAVVPLRRLLWLCQDTGDRLEPVESVTAVGMLASQAPYVNLAPDLMGRLLDNCAEIVKRRPLERLHFTRSDAFWGIL